MKNTFDYLRLRPVNFPDIRIAQFAGVVCRSERLFSKILEMENASELKMLLTVPVSEYWGDHFMFDRKSVKRSKDLGAEAISNIIVNTIVPFLFVYGKQKDEEGFIEKALRFLEETKGENNAVIRKWKGAGVSVKSAHSTQALLQLKNEYCNSKKCLKCQIGNHLLKNS